MKPLLVSCPFDNGIQMMLRFKRGVTGAAAGPEAVLEQFDELFETSVPRLNLRLARYNLPPTAETRDDPDAIRRQQALTDTAHEEVTAQIQQWCRIGYLPLAIGGDHSLTYPLVRGISRAQGGQKLGLIYIDAHLDMRPLEEHAGVTGLVSSGNSFRRLLEDPSCPIAGANVVAIGIHRSQSDIFQAMVDYAQAQSVTIIYDDECDALAEVVARTLAAAQAGTRGIYLSVDIDAVEARIAAGVSAPAERGLSVGQLMALVGDFALSGQLVGFDLVEVSARQQAWGELFGQPFDEPDEAKQGKLKKTARLGAEVLYHVYSGINASARIATKRS